MPQGLLNERVAPTKRGDTRVAKLVVNPLDELVCVIGRRAYLSDERVAISSLVCVERRGALLLVDTGFCGINQYVVHGRDACHSLDEPMQNVDRCVICLFPTRIVGNAVDERANHPIRRMRCFKLHPSHNIVPTIGAQLYVQLHVEYHRPFLLVALRGGSKSCAPDFVNAMTGGIPIAPSWPEITSTMCDAFVWATN